MPSRAMSKAPAVAAAMAALQATEPTQATLDAVVALIRAMIDAGPASLDALQETTPAAEAPPSGTPLFARTKPPAARRKSTHKPKSDKQHPSP